MSAGPGEPSKGKERDRAIDLEQKEKEKAAGFVWAEEVARVKRLWGTPSVNEPLAPVRFVLCDDFTTRGALYERYVSAHMTQLNFDELIPPGTGMPSFCGINLHLDIIVLSYTNYWPH